MEKLFEDKTVFIIGGATGIERACAIAFAAQEVDGGNQTYPAAEYPARSSTT